MKVMMRAFVCLAAAAAVAFPASAQSFAAAVAFPASAQSFAPAERAAIDQGVVASLDQRGVPSASIAVVRGGQIVFAKAYGRRAVSPDRPATTEARYNI